MFNMQLIRLVLCMDSGDTLRNDRIWSSLPASPDRWARAGQGEYDDGLSVGHAALDDWRLNLPDVLQRSANPDVDDSVPCLLFHRNRSQSLIASIKIVVQKS
jgi:hypothetical protein